MKNIMQTSFRMLRRVTTLSALFALCSGASAQIINWSGANFATDINWSDGLNWTGGVVPGTANGAAFGDAGTASDNLTPDNIVSADIQVTSLLYQQINQAWHNTVINSGVTLMVSNIDASIMLDSGSLSDPPSGLTHCYNTISGLGGTLVVNNTNTGSLITVEQGSATYAGAIDQWAQLNMSGLDTFHATVGRLFVGVEGVGATPGQATLFNNSRATGVLYLAKTNVINLTQPGNIQGAGNAAAAGPALVVLDTYQNFDDFSSFLYLGQSNSISADTITIGRHQAYHTAVFEFNPSFIAPTLYLRGATSNRVSEIIVADNTINGGTGNGSVAPGAGIGVLAAGPRNPGNVTGAGAAGWFDVSSGTSDMMIDTLFVGKGHNAAGAGYTIGVFNMGAGTLNVNTLQLGVMSAAAGNTPVIGQFSVNSGTVVVNSNNVALGVKLGAQANAVATGDLTVTGGATLTVANNHGIVDSGQSQSTVTVEGSTVTAANIGTAAAPIGTVQIGDSTLNLAVTGVSGVIVANNMTADSSSSPNITINITSISQLACLSPVIPIVQSGTAIGVNGSADFILGTLPAGYVGTFSYAANTVNLVLTTKPCTAVTWNGGGGANMNWSDAGVGGNWSGSAEPDFNSPAVFGNTGSVGTTAINNIVDGNVTILELTYNNTGGTYHNTSIPNDNSLTVGLGGMNVGSPQVDLGNTTGNVTVTGGTGTLNLVNNGNIYVGLGDASALSTAKATLDMSGLGTFNATVGSLLVGVGGGVGTASVLQPVGTVYLAQTNTITASSGTGNSDTSVVAVDVGDAGDAETTAGYGNNLPSSLYLGRVNSIFANYITVGRQWASGSMSFNPSFFDVFNDLTVYIRGADGVSAVNTWNIGDGVANALTGGAGSGTANFTRGTIDALVNTMNIAKGSSTSVTVFPVTGTLTFSNGTINVNTLNVSYNLAVFGSVDNYGVGTVNVNGTGTLIVNNALNLAFTSGPLDFSSGVPTPTGTLNINGSAAVLANTIVASGTNGVTSTINMNGGTLAATNGIATAAAPLTTLSINNATIDVGFSSTATAFTFIYSKNVTATGVNTINLLSMGPIESFPATVTVIKSVNPIVGSPVNFSVNAPAGYVISSVTESGDSLSILVTFSSGPITPRGTVFWNGPSANILWSNGNNWLLPPVPAPYDIAFFDNVGESTDVAAGADNIVDANITVAGLWYAATNGSAYGNHDYAHNTLINPGVTLTVSNKNASIMLSSGTDTDTGGFGTCYNTISGPGGKLVLNNTNVASSIYVSEGSSTYQGGQANIWASLDMSALDTFNATVGRMLLGAQGQGVIAGIPYYVNAGRQMGNMKLAKTNVITLTQVGNIQGAANSTTAGPALVLNDSPGFGDYGDFLYLGQSNAIYADTITVGRQQCARTAVLQFNPVFTAPTLLLRGVSSNRVSEVILGDDTVNGGNCNANPGSGIVVPPGAGAIMNIAAPGSAGLVDLSAGTSDIMIDTLYVAKGRNANNGGYAAAIFNMGAGTLNVNTLGLGVMSVATATANRVSTGTLNVNAGGNVVVNNMLALGQAVGGGTCRFAYGTLNVNGGTVAASSIVSGGVSFITVTNGTISLTSAAGSIGTAAAPIGSIILTNSTLNLAVSGVGSPVVTSNLTIAGTSDTINVTAMPLISGVPTTNTLIQSLAPISGAYDFVLGTIPAGYTAHLQESADLTAVQLVITAAPAHSVTGAKMTAVNFQPATGGFVMSGTSGLPNSVYYVLTSTDLTLPLSSWTVAGVGTFDNSGNFSITLPYSTGNAQRFFLIKSY